MWRKVLEQLRHGWGRTRKEAAGASNRYFKSSAELLDESK
jgi:hypothetical protein